MITFFRRFRQQLLSENKFSKYLKYAIGEILLVVIGILIALQINNWNEKRKLNIERQQLISSLLKDFEYTKDNINNDRLPVINNALDDIDLFNYLIKKDTAIVSVDSLRSIGVAFFQPYPFIANLSTLNEASSSGKLSLLQNKELFKKFTQFEVYHDIIRRLSSEFSHAYFNGSIWEIRKTVKPDVLAGDNPIPELSYEEYKSILNQPLAQTAFYNANLLIKNKRNRLVNLLETTEDIISILKEMQH